MAFTTRTVVATYTDDNDNPRSGVVTAVLSDTISDGTTSVNPQQLNATLDDTGTATWTLYANDDSTTSPSGTWYYFVERLKGSSIFVRHCAIPHLGNGNVDMLSLSEVTTTPSYSYVLTSAVGAANGVASLDGTGKVPSSQIPSGVGGGGLTPTAIKTSAYNALSGDLVLCDTTSAPFTVTLPNAPADATSVAAKQIIRGGTNTVTVACAGSDVFNKAGGSTTYAITLSNQGAVFQYQHSTGIWIITADDLPLGQLDARYASYGVYNLGDPQWGGFTSEALSSSPPFVASAHVTQNTASLKAVLDAAKAYFVANNEPVVIWLPPGDFAIDVHALSGNTTTGYVVNSNWLYLKSTMGTSRLWHMDPNGAGPMPMFKIAITDANYWKGGGGQQPRADQAFPTACVLDGIRIDGTNAPDGSTGIDYGPGVFADFYVDVSNYHTVSSTSISHGMILRTGNGGQTDRSSAGWCEDTVVRPGSRFNNNDKDLTLIADGVNSFQGTQIGRVYLRHASGVYGQRGVTMGGATHPVTQAVVAGSTITWTVAVGTFLNTAQNIVIESSSTTALNGSGYSVTLGANGTTDTTFTTNNPLSVSNGTYTLSTGTFRTRAQVYQSFFDAEFSPFGAGLSLGTVGTIASGTSYTSIPVTSPSAYQLLDGFPIRLTTSGSTTDQLVVVNGAQAVTSGTTSIAVQSFTANATYTGGSATLVDAGWTLGNSTADTSTFSGRLTLTGEDGGNFHALFHSRPAATITASAAISTGFGGVGSSAASPFMQAQLASVQFTGQVNAQEGRGQNNMPLNYLYSVKPGSVISQIADHGVASSAVALYLRTNTDGNATGGAISVQAGVSASSIFTVDAVAGNVVHTGTLTSAGGKFQVDASGNLTHASSLSLPSTQSLSGVSARFVGGASGSPSVTSPALNDFAVDGTTPGLWVYGGSSWTNLLTTGSFLPLSGGTMTGNIALGSHTLTFTSGSITGGPTLSGGPTLGGVVNFTQTGAAAAIFAGQISLGDILNMNGNIIENVFQATGGTDAINYAQLVTHGDLTDINSGGGAGVNHYLQVSGLAGNALNSLGARTALGLGTASTLTSGSVFQVANVFSELGAAATGVVGLNGVVLATSPSIANATLYDGVTLSDSGLSSGGTGVTLNVGTITTGIGMDIVPTSMTSGFAVRINDSGITTGGLLRLVSTHITSGGMLEFNHNTSASTGNMIFANVPGASGTWTGGFEVYQKAGVTKWAITNAGDIVTAHGNYGGGVYGDGSDGAVTFLSSGSVTVAGATCVSGVYTMQRDIFGSGMTVNNGSTIITNGFRIFDNGTFTNNGTIQWNGSNGGAGLVAGGGAAGAALSSGGSITSAAGNGEAGTVGVVSGNSAASSAVTNAMGGVGGTGGNGSTGTTTAAGTVTAPAATRSPPRFVPQSVLGAMWVNGGTWQNVNTGTGGTGGGGDSTHGGGGGGGAAGIVVLSVYLFAGTGSITATGGTGGQGYAVSSPNTGGGGGGGGGVVIVTSHSIASAAISGQTITAGVGVGGASGGGASGHAGANGSAGTVILVPN